MKKLGFTLVELIITILVIGVLAATVAPRFLGNDSEEATALRDRTLQVVRNVQLRAMQNVNDTSCVKITPSTIAPRSEEHTSELQSPD